MIPDLPTDGDLLARYHSEDENKRVTALVALEKEIYKHLRDRKVSLGEHDLNNVARHTMETLQAAPPNVSNWSELLAEAGKLSELVAVEEMEWLKVLPDLLDETTRILWANFSKLGEEDIKSIANKAFLKVREKYPQLIRDPKALKNTLFEIARNAAKDELKARKRGKRDEDQLQHFEDMAVSHGDASDEDGPKFEPSDRELHPGEVLLAQEKKHTLWQAISKMPKKHAQIFMDLHFHRMKHHEVAEKHGLKIGSIGVYNKRAAEMLLVALAGTLGVFMLMFRYLLQAHVPEANMANNQQPGGAGGTNLQIAKQTPSKPRFTVQFAEIFVGGELMRGAPVTVNNHPSFSPHAVQKIQDTFDADSYLLFSTSKQLQNWYDNWLPDSTQPQFKVVYDRNSHTVHLIGYWDKAVRLDETIPVSNEANLTEILKTVRDHINKAAKR